MERYIGIIPLHYKSKHVDVDSLTQEDQIVPRRLLANAGDPRRQIENTRQCLGIAIGFNGDRYIQRRKMNRPTRSGK